MSIFKFAFWVTFLYLLRDLLRDASVCVHRANGESVCVHLTNTSDIGSIEGKVLHVTRVGYDFSGSGYHSAPPKSTTSPSTTFSASSADLS